MTGASSSTVRPHGSGPSDRPGPTCQARGSDGERCTGIVDDIGYCGRCGVRALPPESPRPRAIRTGQRPATGASRSSGSIEFGLLSSSSGGGPGGLRPLPDDADGDPRVALLADPALPEHKRACRNPHCYEGRSGAGRPRLLEGFCRSCGWGYSFRPPLRPQTVVAERYEVLGAIGRGGLGWVYLAIDQRIGKYVVLKGLLNTDNPEHRRVAQDELRALANTDHPNIVAVHDTVQHPYALPHPGGEVDIDYIVMDHIRGQSLLQRYRECRRQGRYLPILEAGDSVLQALHAVSYLHRMSPHGLLYNDFSPDNLMCNKAGRTWLIDLGGVSMIGDTASGSWGKSGYRDPHDNPPSPQTDIYAVGRTLALLTMPVPGFADGASLPGPDTEPLLARHESFHLLVRRATDPDPARRFASADEMAGQLEAVLREVRAVEEGRPCPGTSTVFGPTTQVVGVGPDEFPAVPGDPTACALALPDTVVDPADRHAGLLSTLSTTGPRAVLRALDALPDPTRETRLRAVRTRLELRADRRVGTSAGTARATAWAEAWRAHLDRRDADARHGFAQVDTELATGSPAGCGDQYATVDAELSLLGTESHGDLRVRWLHGLAALADGHVEEASPIFDEVRRALPGEAAPKLAAGLCAELAGDPATAARHYEVVWRTDHGHVGAAFGLARAQCAVGDPAGAVSTLCAVPPSSAQATTAALCALRVGSPREGLDDQLAPTFFAIAERLSTDHPDRLDIPELRRLETVIAVFTAVAGWIRRGRIWPADPPRPRPEELYGLPLGERSIRLGIEATYRALAADPTFDRGRRIAYVDRANQARNWSRW